MNLNTQQIRYNESGKVGIEFQIVNEALNELQRARKRYPDWPIDVVHATVVMVEEATEALKSANEIKWNHKTTTMADLREEVIQTIAMCLRLIVETPGLADARHPEVSEKEPQ